MRRKNVLITIIVLLIVFLVGWALFSSSGTTEDAATSEPDPSEKMSTTKQAESTGGETVPSRSELNDEVETEFDSVIEFTDQGFLKDGYVVKASTVVTVRNTSSQTLQFSSDDHPTHAIQTELNLKTIAPGDSTKFVPTKVGSWGFHDHLYPNHTGTLQVVAP